MRRFFFLFHAIFMVSFCFAQVKVEHLLTENEVDPLSIDALTPRFSWQLSAIDKRDIMQTAYEIKVSTYTDLKKGKHNVWATGKITVRSISLCALWWGNFIVRAKILLAG